LPKEQGKLKYSTKLPQEETDLKVPTKVAQERVEVPEGDLVFSPGTRGSNALGDLVGQ
jgi:hypothetical protein